MSITSLSNIEISILLVLGFILVSLISICTVANFLHKNRTIHRVLSLSLLIILSIYFSVISDLNQNHLTNFSYVSKIINAIPHYFYYILFACILLFVLYEFLSLSYQIKNNFSAISIKTALENLPCGLAFYDNNGVLFLTNRIIHKISADLTGKDLQNGIEFLKDLEFSDRCVIKDSEPVFILPDNSVWKFSKSTIISNNTSYTRLKADNITDIYKLTNDIKIANDNLNSEQIRLKEYSKNIEKLIAEEETLKVKMAVHNDFGELIAMTVRAYENNSNLEQKNNIIKKWTKLSDRMANSLTFSSTKKYSLEEVLNFSNSLNCKINLTGSLPIEPKLHNLFIDILFEWVKNAVYHAKCDYVNVCVDTQKIILSNKNTNNLTYIKEGGGLNSIRKMTENLSGKMKTKIDDNITLIITFET